MKRQQLDIYKGKCYVELLNGHSLDPNLLEHRVQQLDILRGRKLGYEHATCNSSLCVYAGRARRSSCPRRSPLQMSAVYNSNVVDRSQKTK